MSAKTFDSPQETASWRLREFTLKSGEEAFQGSAICLELGSASCVVATEGDGLLFLGHAVRGVDASAAAKPVTVDLLEELDLVWYDNATSGDAVSGSTHIGKKVFFADDQTVQSTVAGPYAGICLAVDSVKGVLVMRPRLTEQAPAAVGSLPAFDAADSALVAAVDGAIYDVPTTAANSTVTLPADAADGITIVCVADGTKNGHTVQYRDETGPANLTTALTASKRHHVVCTKAGGKWFANAYVSP